MLSALTHCVGIAMELENVHHTHENLKERSEEGSMPGWVTQGLTDASQGLRWPAGWQAELPLSHKVLAEKTQGFALKTWAAQDSHHTPGRPSSAEAVGGALQAASLWPTAPAIPGSSVLTAHVLRKHPVLGE